MDYQLTKAEKYYLFTGAIITWFAVICQFILMMANRVMPAFATIIKFFSFFTILTNILVALCFTFLLMKPVSRWKRFYVRQNALTAIAVYITVVGLVYNLILRHLWNPQGLQRLVDELLHTVIPIFFIIYWLNFVRKDQLKWKDVWPWLIYPFVYLLYTLARGALTGQYPYPFIDVKQHGYASVLTNSVVLFIAFIVLSLAFLAIAKLMGRNRHSIV